MTVRTRIEINPNLRIDGDCTIAHLDEDVYGERPAVLETVEVFESMSGLQGRGWVSEIDVLERTVTLIVDWANLDIPKTHSLSTPRTDLTNRWLASPAGWAARTHEHEDVRLRREELNS